MIQEGNERPVVVLEPLQSNQLDDNRIAIHFLDLWDLQPETFGLSLDPSQRSVDDLHVGHILSQGVTRARFAISNLDWGAVHWDRPEVPIDPRHDQFITDLAENGMILTYVLTFWDKAWVAEGGQLPIPRFKTEAEILRYLDYVRYMVGVLGDRVEYFEIWNEPNIQFSIQAIDVDDYINLVSRAIPVIREVAPEAKIVVGGVGDIRAETEFEYFSRIIESDEIMPLVDVISWHGMYDVSPEYDYWRDYYYGYPALVAEIAETASSHGFHGEYVADELSWRTFESPCFCRHEGLETLYTQSVAAKNYARGILMNLGLGLAVSHFYVVPNAQPQLILRTLRNVSTLMEGARQFDLPITVTADEGRVVTYAFSTSNGDLLVALWNDEPARDVEHDVGVVLKLPSVRADLVMAFDAVSGFGQELVTSQEDEALVIHDLRVGDNPLVLRITTD